MHCVKMIKKIRNILIGWYRKIFNLKSNLCKYRLNICKNCPNKKKFFGHDVCDLCGCELDAKCRVEDEYCYINKW